MRKIGLRVATLVIASLTILGFSTATASAHPARAHHHTSGLSGTTTVTTAPGIATTLLKAGIFPLPQRHTSVRLGFVGGQPVVSYGFPITGGNPDLAAGTGDITHAGGIYFTNFRKSLSIGNFDIDLAAGKVFATKVNGAAARVPVLDLDLSGLQVSTRGGCTVLSGIKVNLDGAAAGAINQTFGVALPTDGSLAFGTAQVVLRAPKS